MSKRARDIILFGSLAVGAVCFILGSGEDAFAFSRLIEAADTAFSTIFSR
ncbi:hypothetical protein FHS85_000117 [Rhodoligotrophos appendicifer]|jgi:hypothetical protein|nr:hypothetical protein [Rhodoligotrophos appendicifer]